MNDSKEKIMADVLQAFVLHKEEPGVVTILRLIASDQGQGFWDAIYNRTSDRWSAPGSLATATLIGSKVLTVLHKTAEVIYTSSSLNRMMMVYLLAMISRWADIANGRFVFSGHGTQGSICTTSLVNAQALGIKLTVEEIQAMTKWWQSPKEMHADHEQFSVQWWLMSQTMHYLSHVASR